MTIRLKPPKFWRWSKGPFSHPELVASEKEYEVLDQKGGREHCPFCDQQYRFHERAKPEIWLRTLCDGTHVKL